MDEKVMFSGEEVGSEKEISKLSYKIHTTPEEMFIQKQIYTLLLILDSLSHTSTKNVSVVLLVFPPGKILRVKECISGT